MNIYEKLMNIQTELKAPKSQFNSGVYAILNPSNKVYIGSSTDIGRRFYQYKGMYEKGQMKLYNSFVKYGVNNHKFIPIEYCEIDKLYERERYWGDHFNSLDRYKGLNLVLPGYGEVKKVMSQETKDKIGKAHEGKEISKEQRKAISKARKGKKQTQEHIEKRKMFGKDNPAYGNTYRKGIPHTEEVKERLSEMMIGKSSLGDNRNAKKVLDNETGKTYTSAKQVALDNDINYSTLKSWLQGVNKGNGRFEYV